MFRFQATVARRIVRPLHRTFVAQANKVSVISVPINLGQPSLGLDKAPSTLIDAGLTKMLGSIGWRWKVVPPLVEDVKFGRDFRTYDDINAKNCLQVGTISEVVKNGVLAHCASDTFPLILGGDHCISIGTISAIKTAMPNTAVVWVDAHGDINTPANSGSGNMHGMPLGFLLGLVDNVNSLPGFQWFKPVLKPEDIVYIGLRDLDKMEKMTIRRLGIKAYTMYDVDRLGMGKVMEEVLDFVGDRNVHLSYDIDAIDPFFAPHTGTAVTGGLTLREGNYICEALYASNRLTSMELVEVDPTLHQTLDPSRTIDLALTIIGSAMGQRIL